MIGGEKTKQLIYMINGVHRIWQSDDDDDWYVQLGINERDSVKKD